MKYVFIPIIAFAVYAFIENKLMLTVRHEKIGNGLRIAHISDIHKRRFGEGNLRLCQKVKAENPDIILLTGDLVSRTVTDFTAADAILRQLSEIAPVYMIFGNHEQDLPAKKQSELEAIILRNGVNLLKNSYADVEIKGRRLKIGGLLESYAVYKVKGHYRNLKKLEKADITALMGDCPEGEVLFMAHNPFFGKAYSEWGADYTFSGHVHGGIVRIFGMGMLSPERKLFPKASKGVYDFGGKKLLVSAGLGKLRFFNPPEIVIYEI